VTAERRVLMIGLGTIARTHLEVLAEVPDLTVVAGVDPAATGLDLPVFPTLDGALRADLAPDLVAVATPTDTHVALVRQLVDRTDALVLSEKPLAVGAADIESVADVADRVRVAHHFAFSPEVEWALAHVRAAGWGRPTRVSSRFNDAYAGLGETRLASYVSSWVDSGPNQVSLLEPFTGPFEVVSHADERVRAVTVLDHQGGLTVLSSNWLAGDSSKQTTLEYDGDRQLHLDHTAMTAVAVEDGVVTEHVGYAGTAGRKHAHYRGLYDVLLADPDDERLGVPLAADIARLLEAASSAPSGAPCWSSIGAPPAT
jgi:predicted dehydrogenase